MAGVLIGASLWGLSGTAAQQLMQGYGVTPHWLVTTRMLVAGLLLLATARLLGARDGLGPWRDPASRWQLVLFALGGLVGVQYSYMASIALGNAATATFLQYLGPAFVTVYEVLRWRRRPRRQEGLALLLATGGTLLLATGGSLDRLAVPAGAVVWGLISALALAFYTLSGAGLLRRWPPALIIGWAMLLGGAAMAVLAPPWHPGPRPVAWDAAAAGLWAFVVLGGTLLAFTLYLASLRHLRPSQTSLLACMEPLAAAASATLWLGVPFTGPMAAGGGAVLAAVLLLSSQSRDEAQGPASSGVPR
ncbi:protein of unknown function DUF6 transmembrane [Thermaerobacter marianensis DSM 12885]|uniref:EamA domain-containing protein n=1 Tax=Thermaerobacter marianensis (strain ATCC 700841 / DSM 12885 / JCM 10246 / 7p75a) TaxID=644966 RepID=E6SMJ3_THEM7|nr:DMT family transporter [Thermaerobacter marianensis]ADU50453.1 protein of unknown function DUF6 transmembrane [Thermaerobacter marianensis DSM 12885]